MINLLPYGIAWAVLAVVVGVLALMRRGVTAHEDDSLHLAGGGASAFADEQAAIIKKLAQLDKWGKILTIILVVTGLILAVMYGLNVWQAASNAGLA